MKAIYRINVKLPKLFHEETILFAKEETQVELLNFLGFSKTLK